MGLKSISVLSSSLLIRQTIGHSLRLTESDLKYTDSEVHQGRRSVTAVLGTRGGPVRGAGAVGAAVREAFHDLGIKRMK